MKKIKELLRDKIFISLILLLIFEIFYYGCNGEVEGPSNSSSLYKKTSSFDCYYAEKPFINLFQNNFYQAIEPFSEVWNTINSNNFKEKDAPSNSVNYNSNASLASFMRQFYDDNGLGKFADKEHYLHIFGMRIVDVIGEGDETLGFSIGFQAIYLGEEWVPAFCFTLVEKIEIRFQNVLNNIERQKAVDFTTIHELAHCRGFSDESDDPLQGQTDCIHMCHYYNYAYCLMRVFPGPSYMKDFIENAWPPHFCTNTIPGGLGIDHKKMFKDSLKHYIRRYLFLDG